MKSTGWTGAALLPIVILALATAPAPAQDDTAPAARIAEVLGRFIGADEPGVAVVVTQRGATVYRGARGLADVAHATPLTPDHRFPIGSLTKPFTAVAVMTLAERGLVGLDAPLSDQLPDYPGADGLTIAQLLSHTSGIRRLHSLDGYWRTITDDVTLDGLIAWFRDEPPASPPGTRWEYANSGYYVVEQAVAAATGLTWDRFLQDSVLEPAGMSHTLCAGPGGPPPGTPTGYMKTTEGWRPARAMNYAHLRAAGGLITDLDDLVRFQRALFGGRLLTGASLRRMFAPAVLADGQVVPYGLGWNIEKLDGRPMVDHGGGVFGFNSHMLYLPEQDLFVAVLSNREDEHADPGIRRLAELVAQAALGDAPAADAAPVVAVAPGKLARLAGDYRMTGGRAQGAVRTLVFDGETLSYDKGQGDLVPMLPSSEREFHFAGAATIIVFDITPDGEVSGMTLFQGGRGGREIVFEKVAGAGD